MGQSDVVKLQVGIVGAGIAGLSAAIALSRVGHQVEVSATTVGSLVRVKTSSYPATLPDIACSRVSDDAMPCSDFRAFAVQERSRCRHRCWAERNENSRSLEL